MRKRYWWISAGIVVVVAAIVFVLRHRTPQQPPQRAPAVPLATVRLGTYAVVLNESGYVGAPAGTTTQVAFANPGILRTLDVSVGDRVSAGEALAALDTRAVALEAAQARAEAQAAAAGYGGGSVPQAAIDAARERVAADRAGVARAQRLYRAGVDALKDVQAARAQLAASQANLRAVSSQPDVLGAQARAAEARAASAQLSLQQGTLYAPTSGVVTAIDKRPGEAVDPSTPVLSIGPPQNEITLSVPGTDAAQIAVGNPVELRLDGTQTPTAGHVIAIVPAVNPATQTATVVVSGRPPNAVAGTAVRARITVAHVRGLIVPESAIVADPQSGQDVVFVQQRTADGNRTFVQRVVTVAHEDAASADIASGVHAGDRVAAKGAFELMAPVN